MRASGAIAEPPRGVVSVTSARTRLSDRDPNAVKLRTIHLLTFARRLRTEMG